jgi:SAM-dependent methyltransferase
MKKNNKVDSKEVGLVAGLNVCGFFLGSKDLHYGYWEEDLEINIRNLPQAQQRFSQVIKEKIPQEVNRILDVGCGAGKLAAELKSSGYIVEGVSPSRLLTAEAHENAGDDFIVHQGRFEEVEFAADDKFDMVMFSESFQYVPLNVVLGKAASLLSPGGYVLIADFFKTGAPGKSVIGGGHDFSRFKNVLENSGLEIIEDKDITKQTAPNLEVVKQMEEELFKPLANLVSHYFTANRPWFSKIIQWLFRGKLEKVNRKYLSGARNAEAFSTHKIYKLYLLQKRS